VSSAASRRRLNAAITSLHRFARSPKVDVLHSRQSGVDLNLTAYGVLGAVISEGPVALSALASLTGVVPSALSRQVKLLEDGGHITRQAHAEDARVAVVAATPAGRDAHQRLRAANDQMLVRQLRSWTTEEIEDPAAGIERLVTDLRRTDR
jgi:DNA-binding MarR family transcriptional regulator